MDHIPASRPIPSDNRPDLRPEEAQYEQTYQTLDGDQGTYESLSHPSAQETEQRPPRRKVGFRCALALGVLLIASILGLVAFTVYHFTAKTGCASTTASACGQESWTPFNDKGVDGLGAVKPLIRTDADCRSSCEADLNCVYYEFGSGNCYFISESFVEPADRVGHIFYKRQRTCGAGVATCIFTYEGRYDLDNVLDPARSSEPNLDSCFLRCLNTARVCKGLSFNTQGVTGDCEPRNVQTDLESRTLENDHVEYTMACME